MTVNLALIHATGCRVALLVTDAAARDRRSAEGLL